MGRKNQKESQEAPPAELSDDDIKTSLKYNGHPLEIRLLAALDAAKVDPISGHRFLVPGGSVEVDLVANVLETMGNDGMVIVKAFIEAKQMDPYRRAFVGFKWKRPTLEEMRSLRIRFCAKPTCQVSDDPALRGASFIQTLLGDELAAQALDVLGEGIEVCRNWCSPEPKASEKDQLIARKDEQLRNSYARLLDAVTAYELSTAAHFARPYKPELLRIELVLPTVVIGLPKLHVYDAVKDTVERVDRFILHDTYEHNGRIHARYVDVVTETGLPDLVDRWRAAVIGLRDRLAPHATALLNLVHEQSRSGAIVANPLKVELIAIGLTFDGLKDLDDSQKAPSNTVVARLYVVSESRVVFPAHQLRMTLRAGGREYVAKTAFTQRYAERTIEGAGALEIVGEICPGLQTPPFSAELDISFQTATGEVFQLETQLGARRNGDATPEPLQWHKPTERPGPFYLPARLDSA